MIFDTLSVSALLGLVRTVRRFGAHHFQLWCAPKLPTLRSKINGIIDNLPADLNDKR